MLGVQRNGARSSVALHTCAVYAATLSIHAATQLILGQHIVDILPCSIALGMGGPFGYLPGVRFGSKAELAPDARPSRFFPLKQTSRVRLRCGQP